MISIEHFKNIVKCGSELTIDGNFYYKVVFIDSTFIEFYHPLNQRYIRILLTAFCSNIKIMEWFFQSGAISGISITLIDERLFQAQPIDIKETPTFPVGAPVLCFFCKGNGFINKLSHVQSCEKCKGSGLEAKPEVHCAIPETCIECNGTGYIVVPPYGHMHCCDKCDGDGVVPKKKTPITDLPKSETVSTNNEIEALKKELAELKKMHDNLAESYVQRCKYMDKWTNEVNERIEKALRSIDQANHKTGEAVNKLVEDSYKELASRKRNEAYIEREEYDQFTTKICQMITDNYWELKKEIKFIQDKIKK